MPRVSILTSYNKSISDINILSNYLTGMTSLDAKQQYLIGEVVMLRLFSIFEVTVSDVALKLACGARYRNGNIPIVLTSCRSVSDAHSKMLNYNRRRPLRYLKWTGVNYINNSILYVLNNSDSFYVNVNHHSLLINEMRVVRNHIAHRTRSTQQQFNSELMRLYGANPRLSMGAFLLATNRQPLANINKYIQATKIIMNDITSG